MATKSYRSRLQNEVAILLCMWWVWYPEQLKEGNHPFQSYKTKRYHMVASGANSCNIAQVVTAQLLGYFFVYFKARKDC